MQELQARVRAGNAELYRHVALYLQVLRQVLPVRVERAVFHLATQLQPRRYALVGSEERHQLHRRLRSLVHRCTSLLTVEQLVSLAAQMARERERQERRDRQRLLQRFSEGPADLEGLGLSPLSDDLPLPTTGSATPAAPQPLPEGSVNLDGSRPLSAGLLQSLSAAIAASPPDAPPLAGPPPMLPTGFGPGSAADPHDGPPPDSLEPAEPPASPDPAGASLLTGLPLPPLLQRLIEESPRPSQAAEPWRDARLPDDPLLLLRWLEGVDQALARRLRNLSHAINVELLRSGLSGSLLPVSLLDGVLAGQIEVQPAPPNLLRLQLPFPAEDASPLVMIAVLLRRVDLELEEPRLRTCRRRLQQHRQEVRRMAQQFRRLQRRREAHEAEQLWLQDRHASLSPPG